VFGCGGDRDQAKRPLMGQVADQFADQIVVTSDNPRNEDPLSIIDQIVAGIEANQPFTVQPDRRQAIAECIKQAGADDLVLIAGKGHEDYQEGEGNQRIPLSDRCEVVQLLKEDLCSST
ncbi:MAG: UDP-N-acetylmuramoyl-L-alanyl-D-glutamate--2,6-diaminopimelate ligase, partial [Gammaproteobacteria bacterium]|nr:UDP-N-acetylmuramoyl-L-alanyl-D-glutamate--2,6-diaminopimelate ligase [Gammaproteobacteria bacterium]